MSRYTPLTAAPPPSYPPRPASHRRGSPSTASLSSSHTDPSRHREMEAAFDDSDSGSDSDGDDENRPLARSGVNNAVVWEAGDSAGLPEEDAVSAPADGLVDPLRSSTAGSCTTLPAVGSQRPTDSEDTYDFDRDYFLPPPGSPPPGAYPENYLPTGPTPLTTTPQYPSAPSAPSRFIRSILPTHFIRSVAPSPRGSDGVFANLTAKPEVELPAGIEGEDGDNTTMMAEFSSKDAPPAYNIAARDAVPPYWEHNVVAPSFGPLGSITGSGDDLLIDGLPVGNFFGFIWNLLVSMSFQFVGFLLTYVLHTTHSSKYGSRAGLGVTLIQYGFYLRTRAQTILDTGNIDPDPSADGASLVELLLGGGGVDGDGGAVESISSTFASLAATATATATAAFATPTTFGQAMEYANEHPGESIPGWGQMGTGVPSAEEVSEANEWLSFVLMCVGWFILITSLGGYWRVKRYERSLVAAQEADDVDASAVQAPIYGVSALRDWYRSRTQPSSSSSTAADNTSYPGADLGIASDEVDAQSRPRDGDNAFRRLGSSLRDFGREIRERARVMAEFRARQRERERRDQEESMYML